MSLFSPKKSANTTPSYTGIQIQTAVSALPIPLFYGRARGAPNLIWYDDFKTIKKKVKQGKGMGGKQTETTYSASLIMSVGSGEIYGIGTTWTDQKKGSSYTALGFSLFTGADPQSVWGYLTTKHPGAALHYNGIAYLAVANYQLGSQPTLPNHNFEIFGLLYNTQVGGDGDADPALVIQDFLTNPAHGAGFPVGALNTVTLLSGPNATTTGDSAYQTYCRAMGFGISPTLVDSAKALETISTWTMITNAEVFWSGSQLKFIPWGDETVTANGVTYLPDTTIQYDLTDADFHYAKGEDPIMIERSDPSDAKNVYNLEIKNRAADYNLKPIQAKDQNAIELFGELKADTITAHAICVEEMATTVAYLQMNRLLHVRQRFTFKLSWEYCLLEPMDYVTITTLIGTQGLNKKRVRIEDANEDEEGITTFIAEECPLGVSSTGNYAVQGSTPGGQNRAVLPGPVNPPLLFEPPSTLTNGIPQVWAVVSGGDGTNDNPNWGGCEVYISTDNTNFSMIGSIDAPGTQGKLSAILATYAGVNPDIGHTLAVDMGMSAGELLSGTAADAAAGHTLCYVDGELIGYEVATLTGTDAYNVTSLYRGMSGSTVGAHAIGTKFARLDDQTFKYQLPNDLIGKTLYLKFASYNIFNYELEDLSTVTTYTYVPTGLGSTSVAPAGVMLAQSAVVQGDGSTILKLTTTMATASTGPFLDHYEVQYSTDAKVTWQPAGVIAGSALVNVYQPALASTTYWTRIRAVSAAPLVSPSAWVESAASVTTPAIAAPVNPFGFSFSRAISTITISDEVVGFSPGIAWNTAINLPNSNGVISGVGATAPTSTTNFDIRIGGVSYGTMRFASGSLTATFIMAAVHTIPANTAMTVYAPANLNGMVGRLDFTILGAR